MARGAVVAISVHGGWIGGKCRLARLTIASGFGEGIDGSYRGDIAVPVFLNRSAATFSCWSNSRQENPNAGAASDLERPIFAIRVGVQRSSLDPCRTMKPPLLIVAAAFALGESRCLLLSEREPNCNSVGDRPAAW
jgi:hypothetical protein